MELLFSDLALTLLEEGLVLRRLGDPVSPCLPVQWEGKYG